MKPIIDCHAHITSVNAIEAFNGVRADSGVPGANIACIHLREPHINVIGLLAKALRPADTWVCGGLDYNPPGRDESGLDFAAQVRRLVELGADGIQMIEGKPSVRREIGYGIDDPRYRAMFEWLEQAGIPLLLHVADPEEFWDDLRAPEFARLNNWLYSDPSYAGKEQLYAECGSVLSRHPRLRVVLAHFYFLSAEIERAAAFLDTHPNVCFDITPGSEMYWHFSKRPSAWKEFFTRYRDRILFGTDNDPHSPELAGWARQNTARLLAFLRGAEAFSGPGLELASEVLDGICHDNFVRLFGERPRPVDAAALIAQSAIQLEHARAGGGDEHSVEELERVMQKLVSLV